MYPCILYTIPEYFLHILKAKQTTKFKESEAVNLDFRRLRSGQVWEQQSQEKHGREEGREEGGAVLLGDRFLCAEHILPC